jgi:hypothetical protein
LGDLGEEGDFSEEELEGWEEFESEDDPWEDGEDPFTETKDGEGDDAEKAAAEEAEAEENSEFKDPVAQEYERMVRACVHICGVSGVGVGVFFWWGEGGAGSGFVVCVIT